MRSGRLSGRFKEVAVTRASSFDAGVFGEIWQEVGQSVSPNQRRERWEWGCSGVKLNSEAVPAGENAGIHSFKGEKLEAGREMKCLLLIGSPVLCSWP